MRAGIALDPTQPPDLKDIHGVASRLVNLNEIEGFWRIGALIRTAQEEAKALWNNGQFPADPKEFPHLSGCPEWHLLENGPSNRVHLLSEFRE
jgi:hypothetical protein